MKVGYAPSVPVPDTNLNYQQEADTSLLSRGVRGIAAALEDLGSSYDKEQDRAARFKALTDLTDFQQKQGDRLAELKAGSTPGSTALPTQWDQSVEADKEKFLAGVPEKLKPEFEWRIDQFRMGGHGDIRDFQTRQNEEFYKVGTKDVTDKSVQEVDKDPSVPNLEVQQKKTESIIDSSGLSNLDKAKAKQEARQKLQGTSLYHQKLVGNEYGSFTSLIAHHEGFRSTPYIDHYTTSHASAGYRIGYGSNTVTLADGTVLPVKPGMHISRADADRDTNRRFTQDYEPRARASIGPTYDKFDNATKFALGSVAHNYGSLPKSVIAAAKTGDKEVLARAVQSLPANPGRRAEEANIIRAGGDVGALPAYADVTADQREAIDKRVGEQYRATIPDQVNDIVASTAANGSYSGQEPSHEAFKKAWPDDGDARYNDFQTKKEAAGWVNQFQTMPEADINRVIGETKAGTPTGAGAEEASKGLATMVTARNAVVEARNKAPADYVYQTFPEITNAWRQFDARNPETARQAIALTLDKQEQLGIPPANRMPLPSAVTKVAGQVMTDPTKTTDQKASAFIAMMGITNDPVQQNAIVHQLITDEGLPSSVEAAAIAAQRGDVEAAKRLFAATQFKPDDYPLPWDKDTAATNIKLMEDQATAQIKAPNSLGETYYGLMFMDPANGARADRDAALVGNLARLYISSRHQPKDAVDMAIKDLFGDVKAYNKTLPGGRGNVSILVPSATYEAASQYSFVPGGMTGLVNRAPPPLELGFTRLVPQVEAVVSERAQAAHQQLHGTLSDAVIQDHYQRAVDDVMTQGAFRRFGNGIGFYDPYRHGFVADRFGKPLMWTLDQVISLGQVEPQGEPSLRPFDASQDKPRQNSDGSVSTEITRTVETPQGWANVPSLWWRNGQPEDFGHLNDDQLANMAQGYEGESGKTFPRYKTLDEAEAAAKARSAGGGASQGSLAQ
jgi:GH24 family phage-related lysozyme (muramidase)